ncbi:hypothetical protein QCD85_05945 [Paenibacillus sp. PsM32]|uniref:hypothetical protein n=1 Tax=unclassified Paenibacillus TaxID=185978 RepID=UPI00236679D9|nr:MULTISPECIES: hypothetical protein [unclassified Paenibacillus]MDN4617631.1 hypothetical protein [Paenibacillus sp. PsM32]WDF52912.1 hypothetical protein PQ460_11005 [Paenibacillus sp. KACC 21273]
MYTGDQAEDNPHCITDQRKEIKERKSYVEQLLLSFEEDQRVTRETIVTYKRSIADSFKMGFPLLQSTFLSELRRWNALSVHLQLTNSNALDSSGIKLHTKEPLSQVEKESIAWAFWSASMHILSLPICLLQVQLLKESQSDMIIETLNMLASSKQVIVFNADPISNKGSDSYQSSGRGVRASDNHAASVFSTSDE